MLLYYPPISTRSFGGAFIIIFVFFIQLSCGSEPKGSEHHEEPEISFSSGDFLVSTLQVDDQCLDGGLNPLFMPRGDSEPWEWPHPVELHSFSELPVTYAIDLRDPFHEMTVTATRISDSEQQLVAETNPSVQLDPERFGECVAELDGVVDLALIDANNAEGLASLTMRNPRGDERCPAGMPESCNVTLRFEATRLDGNEQAGASE